MTSPLYSFASHTFTPCGATGSNGPTIDQCRTEYAIKQGLSWPVQFLTMKTQGVQEWVVPASGSYKFTAAGARGGAYSATFQGGAGRIVERTMNLEAGAKLHIVVGQEPVLASGEKRSGGGGGTFVFENTVSPQTVALVAGGGGGFNMDSTSPGGSASSGPDGVTGALVGGGLGGTGGQGGKAGTAVSSYPTAPPTVKNGKLVTSPPSEYIAGPGQGGFGIADIGPAFQGKVESTGGGWWRAQGGVIGQGGFGGGGSVGYGAPKLPQHRASPIMPSPTGGAGGGGGYSGGGGGSFNTETVLVGESVHKAGATVCTFGSDGSSCGPGPYYWTTVQNPYYKLTVGPGGGGGSFSPVSSGYNSNVGDNAGPGYVKVQFIAASTPSPTPAPTTRAPTPSPTLAPTSAAPLTPSPTSAPMPPPAYLRYPPNFVILVHEGEWMSTGALKVMTLRGSTPSLQPFAYKDLTQVFAIDANGSIRTVAGQGEYVNYATNCDGVVGGSNASRWQFTPRNLPRSYAMEVVCASTLGTKRIDFNSATNPWALFLSTSTAAGTGWFVVPVARTDG